MSPRAVLRLFFLLLKKFSLISSSPFSLFISSSLLPPLLPAPLSLSTVSADPRPQNGSMILYNRKKVKYRKDGYCWKKRKDGKTTREDHMKLKVQGVEVSVLHTRALDFKERGN